MLTKQQIFESVKNIIFERNPHIKKETITEKSKLSWDLGLDSLELLEILMDFEKEHKINIEEEPVSQMERAKTLGEYCDVIFKTLCPDIAKIKSKEDVFKYVKSYLLNKYEIMNANMKDNFFVDLHFQDTDRSDIIKWAEATFNIKLPRTYFLNLDDFCENVLKCLPKQEVVKQPKNKFQIMVTKTKQLVK